MIDHEKDYLRRQVRDLERANRGWKPLAVGLTLALAAVLVLSTALGFALQTRGWEVDERLLMERERAMAAEAEARAMADRAAVARQQAEEQRRLAEQRLKEADGAQ